MVHSRWLVSYAVFSSISFGASMQVVPAQAAAGALIEDSFSGVNGTPVTAHSPEINLAGGVWTTTSPALTLRNQQLAVSGTFGASAMAMIDAGAADSDVSVNWTSTTWGWGSGALVFRATDTSNYWMVQARDPAIWLVKVTNGVAASLGVVDYGAGYSAPYPGTHSLRVKLEAAAMSVYFDGWLALQATDSFNVAATRYGVQWFSYDPTAAYDDFVVGGTLPPAAARTVVTPGPTSVLFRGSQTLTAQSFDPSDALLPNALFAWTSSNPSAVTVTSLSATTASVTGVGSGTATITAIPTRGPSGSVSVTVDPGTFLVWDDFAGPDGTVVNAHPPTISQIGSAWSATSAAPGVINRQLGVSGTFATSTMATIDAGASDATVAVDWMSPASYGMGALIFRASDAGNHWMVRVWDPCCLDLAKVVNGTVTWVASADLDSPVTPSTHQLKVALTGTSIKFYFDGRLAIQATDAFNVAATMHGVQWYASSTAARFDNFQVIGTLPPGPSRVAVTPVLTTVAFKGSRTLTAQGFDATNTLLPKTAFAWTSSNPEAAAVTSLSATTANVVGVGAGSTTITAIPIRGASGTATVTVDPGAYLVYDTFSGTDGTPLTAHVPSISQIGSAWSTSASSVSLSGQRVVTSVRTTATALIDAAASDGTVSVDWTSSVAAGGGRLIFRAVDERNYWRAYDDEETCGLDQVADGVARSVVSLDADAAPATPPLAGHLAVTLAGASIVLSCSGTPLRVTDAFNVTATRYGLQWAGNDGTGAFDNFSVTGVLPPSAARVNIAPGSTSIAFSDHQVLTAQAYDAVGNVLTGVSFRWTSSDSAAVRVSAITGTTASVYGEATGSATITAIPLSGASGAVRVSVTPGSYTVYDRFTDPEGTLLARHAPNVNQIGRPWAVIGAMVPKIRGEQAGTSGTAGDADAVIDGGTPDGSVGVTWRPGAIPSGGSNYGGLIFRRRDALNYFLFDYWNGRVTLWRVVNGSWQNLWSDTAEVLDGFTYRFSVHLAGPTIRVLWDEGVLTHVVTDSFNISSTLFGVPLTSWDADATYDDFWVAGTLPPIPDHVLIAPAPIDLTFGQSTSIVARAFDASNNPIPGTTFAWTTSNPLIAVAGPITAFFGAVRGTGTGVATITATPPRGPSATVAVSVSPGSYLVYDSFTDGDGVALSAHRPEVSQMGAAWSISGPPVASVQGGQAARAATNLNLDVTAVIDAATPNAVANVVWTAGATPDAGANYGALIFRLTDAHNYFLLGYWNGRVSLSRVASDRGTLLWSDTADVQAGQAYSFTASLSGPTIQVNFSDILTRTVTDTFNMSATQYGFVLSGWDAGAKYDAFSVTGTLPPAIPSLSVPLTTLTLAPFDTREVIAQATDNSGHAVPGAFVQWRSSNPSVATVTIDSDTAAKVEALTAGTAVLTAHAPIGPALDVTVPVTVSVCVGALAAASVSVDWHGDTKTLTVTAPGGCEWTAWSRVPWITVVGGVAGNGPQTVTYTVDENNSIPRTGALVVGGRLLTVSQDSEPCTYQLWPESAHWGADGGTGGFQVWVSGGCPWEAMVTQPAGFLSAMGSGGASGFVSYSVDPNPYGYARGNTIHIGTAIFNVAQEDSSVPGGNLGGGSGPPPCTYVVSPPSTTVPPDGGSVVLAITTPGDCSWVASSDAPWITVSPPGGTGIGTVTLAVASASDTTPRIGHVAIANQTVTLTQGTPCSMIVSPSAVLIPAAGAASGVLSILGPPTCLWTVGATAPWLQFSPSFGTGPGILTYAVDPTMAGRVVIANIGGAAVRFTQQGWDGSYGTYRTEPRLCLGCEPPSVPIASQECGLPDCDGDGIDDALEQYLAVRWFPITSSVAPDCGLRITFPIDLNQPVIFRARYISLGGVVDPSYMVINYEILYDRDCGTPNVGGFSLEGHEGDNEPFAVFLSRAPDGSWDTPASFRLLAAVAHSGTAFEIASDSSAVPLRSNPSRIDELKPSLWIGYKKHGNFAELAKCVPDWLNFCANPGFRYPYRLVNVGERLAPFVDDLASVHSGWAGRRVWTCSQFYGAGVIRDDLYLSLYRSLVSDVFGRTLEAWDDGDNVPGSLDIMIGQGLCH